MHLVGSPRSIVVFEAAARSLSFTRAAEELSVSQPAVSRQIRELETVIGCRLFHRTGNTIVLTRSGQQLFETVETSLRRITQTIGAISDIWTSNSVAIRSHVTLLSNFVIPLWTEQETALPDIAIEILSARNDAPISFEGPGIAILYGDGSWSGFAAERLIDDQLFPVCAPATLARHGEANLNSIITREPLLQLSNYVDKAMDWSFWAEQFQLPPIHAAVRHVFNDYEMLLQSCKSGRGIAIGSRCVVAPSLRSGQLVRLSDLTHETELGYYLVYDRMIAENPRIRRLIEFLKREAAAFSRQTRQIVEAH